MSKYVAGQRVFLETMSGKHIAIVKESNLGLGNSVGIAVEIETTLAGAQLLCGQFCMVPYKGIEPLITDLFDVGDVVGSNLRNKTVLGDFIVTGFEAVNNRVVVRPKHQPMTERVRYAYKGSEMDNLTRGPIKLVPGKMYSLQIKAGGELILCEFVHKCTDPYTREEIGQFIYDGHVLEEFVYNPQGGKVDVTGIKTFRWNTIKEVKKNG